MTKKERVQQTKLHDMESEFRTLLPELLLHCAKGRCGLFGRYANIDPEDRYWPWPEARHLRALAGKISGSRSAYGEIDPLVKRFLGLCGAAGSNAEGEPKIAARLLSEIQRTTTDSSSRPESC